MLDKSDDKLRRIAFHEAGHCWMMVTEGLGVKSVSLRPDMPGTGDNRGETLPEKSMEEGNRGLAEKFARAALAGSAAEQYLMGAWDEGGLQASAYDTGRARSYMAMSGSEWKPEALEYYVQVLSNSTMDQITEPGAWHAITSLAYKLLEVEVMSGEEVNRILSDW